MTAPWICPSILSANFMRLGEEIKAVLAAGADRIHVDVMDQHYVPNLTFGPLVCEALRDSYPEVAIDVHLMVEPVDALIQNFAKAGATCIVFHPEASKHVHRSLMLTKELGCEAGLALNPVTPLSYLDHSLSLCDRILIMSVNPGFGGQKFIPDSLAKIKTVREQITALNLATRLEVDGGVNQNNIAEIQAAGADTFVAGSAIFGCDDYATAINALRDKLRS